MDAGNIFEILNQEIQIPEVVQNKANEAFARIQCEALQSKMEGNKRVNTGALFRKGKRRKLTMAILVTVLILGTITVGAAAYMKWSQGIEEEFYVSEEKKQFVEDSGVVDFPGVSVNDGGVTVTVKQSMVDDYFAFVAFKVEGFEIQEGMEPGFVETKVDVEGETINSFGDFYDGIISDGDGRAILADGSEIPWKDGQLVLDYRLDDGSLEYRIAMCSYNGKKGAFIDKTIHVELKDLGIYTQKAAPPEVCVEGQWDFEWQLGGSDASCVFDVNAELEGSGVIVKQIEISPISMKASFEFSRIGVNPPSLTGVKLTDGTVIPNIYMGPGLRGYKEGTYIDTFLVDRILDVDEIEAVLFRKDKPYDREAPIEDMYYIVNIRS